MNNKILSQKINEILSNKIDYYKIENLTSEDRLKIYSELDKYSEICATTEKTLENANEKAIIIRKKTNETYKNFKTIIDFFSTYSGVPIPVSSEKYLNYYLTNLDKYYNSIEYYDILTDELKKTSIYDMKSECVNIKRKIIEHIRSDKEYIEFVNKDIVKLNSDITTQNKFYSEINKNKIFLSIDIISANFRSIKHYCPGLFDGEWKDFIRKFTNNEFLIRSKFLREITFGELGCKKIRTIPILFINDIDKHLMLMYNNDIKKVYCSADEIIYEIMNDKLLEIENMKKIENTIEEFRFGYYRVDIYKLKQIGGLPYFIKEYLNKDKLEFKNVPKKFIMQIIKYYEGNEITELDRKFTDDSGLIATYDETII